MIEIQTQPDILHLSHQETRIKAKTDEHITGAPLQVRLWVNDGYWYDFRDDAGHDTGTHYVRIMDEDFEIRVNASGLLPINLPGSQIHPKFSDSGYTNEEWYAHLKEQILLNTALTDKFNIEFNEGASPNIVFTSKEYGEDVSDYYDAWWSEDGTYNFITNMESPDELNAGADATYDSGVRIGLEILDANENPITSDPWWRVPLLTNITEFDGTGEWEISHVLQAKLAKLEPGFSSNYLAGSPYVRHRNHFKYKLRATVMLSDGSTTTTTTNWKYCLYGKPSWYQQAQWNETGGSFYNDILTNGKFLTQQPQQKNIGWNGPEWLYFINPYNNADCTIEITSYYNDGSTTSKSIGPFEAYPYDVWQIDVSPRAMQLSGTPLRFELHVQLHDNVTGTNYNTETRIFNIDYTAYAQNRIYIFRNHYGGGFDTMRATGMLSATGKIERETLKKDLPQNYTFKDFEYHLVNAEFNAEFELNWGFIQQYGGDVQQWIQYMRQLELSDMAFEYMDGQVFPCEFLTEKWTMWDDENPNPEHISTFRRAYVDKGHSNDPIELAPDYNNDFNEDYMT